MLNTISPWSSSTVESAFQFLQSRSQEQRTSPYRGELFSKPDPFSERSKILEHANEISQSFNTQKGLPLQPLLMNSDLSAILENIQKFSIYEPPKAQPDHLPTALLETLQFNGAQVSITPDPLSSQYETDIFLVQIEEEDAAYAFNVEGNTKVCKTSDGYAVYSDSTGITTYYGSDGTVSTTEGDHISSEADTLLVVPGNSELTIGDGNNLVVLWGDNAAITVGNGNNEIVSYGANTRIEAGDGNNTVRGGGSITLGNGNNTIIGHVGTLVAGDGDNCIEADTLQGSTVTLGNGNNALHVSSMDGCQVTMGHGNNIITAYEMKNDASLTLGNGNNLLDIHAIGQFWSLDRLGSGVVYSSSASVHLGNGDNVVRTYSLHEDFFLEAGDGNNVLFFYEMNKNSSVMLGDGNNTVEGYAMHANASLTTGHGNNDIFIHAMNDETSLAMGDGNNSLFIRSMTDETSVSLGDGNNDVYVDTMEGNATVALGDGNNIIFVQTLQNWAFLNFGHGNNQVVIAAMQDDGMLNAGDGNNVISVNEEGYRVPLFYSPTAFQRASFLLTQLV